MSVVLLFATLAAGILIGVAWSERGSDTAAVPMADVDPAPQAPDGEDAEEPDPDGGRERRRPVIFELDLDTAQLNRLETQRQYYREQFEQLDGEMQREMGRKRGQLRRAAWDSVRAVLRPEQVPMYDSLLTARYSRNDTTRSEGGRGNGRDRGRRPDGQDGNRRPFGPQHWKDY
jgi:hypothetical protein